jgi:hypothetical protein
MKLTVFLAALCAVVFVSSAEAKHRWHHRLPWYGIFIAQHFGLKDRKLWVARNWVRVGRAAYGPAVGTIVVWRHYVEATTGRVGNQWRILSGNDGNAARNRPRSVSNAIAFRWP